jgi:hypothetical protein
MASSVAIAQREFRFIDRNQDNYTLVLDYFIPTNGEGHGDAYFTISECPQRECFHLSGLVKLPMKRSTSGAIQEGDLEIPGLACEIHILDVPKKILMDSGDYRVTFVDSSRDGKGCASLPAGLIGFYQQVSQSSRP